MGSGVPLVCADLPGNREIIDNNIEGFLAEPENPASYCKAILNIFNNPDLSEEVGRKAKNKISTNFNSNLIGKKLEVIYSSLIDKSRNI